MARNNERSNEVVVAEVMDAGVDEKVFRGKSFSITGHLSQTRERIVSLIEGAGGTFHKTPAWGTTYLITNADWSEGSTIASGTSRKLEAARRNGVKIINERTFLDLLTQSPGEAKS